MKHLSLGLLVLALFLGGDGIKPAGISPVTALPAAWGASRRLSERVWHGHGYKQIEEGITVAHLKGSEAAIREQYEVLLRSEIAAFTEAARRNRALRGLAGRGCTNLAAFGPATTDGRLWHGRTFDFYGLGAMDRYRVVYIMEPAGKIPYASIGWAGWNGHAWVHTAMNTAGISLGYMWANSLQEKMSDAPVLWEIFRRVIENSRDLRTAIEIIRRSNRVSAANLLITDAKVPDAVVVEMTSRKVNVRRATPEGTLQSTNHFVSTEMREPVKDPNSFARYQRASDLLKVSHRRIDLPRAVSFLRDRYDVRTKRESLSGDVIAWNIGVMAAVFSPSDLTFWVTKGLAPAVYSEFVGFNLKDELAGAQAGTRLPMIPEDPVVRSQEYQGFMAYQAGYIASLEGDFDQAVKKIREAIPTDPRSGRYHFSLATAYMYAGKYPEAIRAFQEALATDMNDVLRAYSYFYLGRMYEEMGNADRMRAFFAKVLILAIGDPEIEGHARKALGSQK